MEQKLSDRMRLKLRELKYMPLKLFKLSKQGNYYFKRHKKIIAVIYRTDVEGTSWKWSYRGTFSSNSFDTPKEAHLDMIKRRDEATLDPTPLESRPFA